LVVVVAEKTTQGAWIVLLLIPSLVMLFQAINHYYREFDAREAQRLRATAFTAPKLIALVLVSRLGLGMRKALAVGRAIDGECRAVHVSIEEGLSEQLIAGFQREHPEMALEILPSPYRSLLGPLSDYIERLRGVHPDSVITIIMPELIVRHWWERLLHHNSALLLRWGLLPHKNVVVVEVPFDPATGE
jgi:hypothetical protein